MTSAANCYTGETNSYSIHEMLLWLDWVCYCPCSRSTTCLCGFTLHLFACLFSRSASTCMCNLIQKCVCVQLVGCVGQLLMMLSGSLLSHEMIQTHGLTGWPTFTGTGNWITAGRTQKSTKYICRVPVTLQNCKH